MSEKIKRQSECFPEEEMTMTLPQYLFFSNLFRERPELLRAVFPRCDDAEIKRRTAEQEQKGRRDAANALLFRLKMFPWQRRG